jgi:hypothetical protein
LDIERSHVISWNFILVDLRTFVWVLLCVWTLL